MTTKVKITAEVHDTGKVVNVDVCNDFTSGDGMSGGGESNRVASLGSGESVEVLVYGNQSIEITEGDKE